MFVLQPKPTFVYPVSIPTADGDVEIQLTFNHKGKKALKAFFASLGEGDNARTDLDAISELVSDWSGVGTPYSQEALDILLDNYPSSAKLIFEAYNKGLFEGLRKNS